MLYQIAHCLAGSSKPYDTSQHNAGRTFKQESTWLCRETVNEAVWRGPKPAMHLVIPQHSKAAWRNCVPSDLRIAPKTASSMCKGRLQA